MKKSEREHVRHFLLKLFKLLNPFEIRSGLKVNCSKTEGMWIGSKTHYKEKPFGIKWPDEPIKALGVYFTYDQNCLKKRILLNDWIQFKSLLIYGPLEACQCTVR